MNKYDISRENLKTEQFSDVRISSTPSSVDEEYDTLLILALKKISE